MLLLPVPAHPGEVPKKAGTVAMECKNRAFLPGFAVRGKTSGCHTGQKVLQWAQLIRQKFATHVQPQSVLWLPLRVQ
eukprot:6462868-Amphidinium_carterae.6